MRTLSYISARQVAPNCELAIAISDFRQPDKWRREGGSFCSACDKGFALVLVGNNICHGEESFVLVDEVAKKAGETTSTAAHI